jgi:Asp-tRNA(Asn)/Glu-tRNA(Gln) amidotransferase A subunit family amidase
VVRRHDPQSLERETGVERLLGRDGLRRRRRARAVWARFRDARQHRLAEHALRRHRPAADVRPRQSRRLHSVEDCALVLGAIHGSDPKDPAAVDRPFHWPGTRSLKEFRVGHSDTAPKDELKVLSDLGVELVPVRLPYANSSSIVGVILNVEAGAAFDDITRAGVSDGIGAWGTSFRGARFVSGVDYLRAQRARTLLMREMTKVFEKVDCYIGGGDLSITNLTGHPTVCLPNGFGKSGAPTALTFTGKLFGETDLLTVARAYQDATGHHQKRPPEETWVAGKEK